MRSYDIIIVGCGVVGAAVAYELSKYELGIGIIEKENDLATGATKANSGIVHAGFDPEPGSLMAKLNVRGAELAERIAKDLNVPYERTGAMVVALSEAELPTLDKLYERGRINGVKGLRVLSAEEARAMEPGLSHEITGALYAPTSAIISPWEYCLAFAETAVTNGAEINFNCELTEIERKNTSTGEGWHIRTSGGDFFAPIVINAAGLNAIDIHDLVSEKKYSSTPRIGEYFLLDKSEGNRVSRTVFQCPNENGKGVLVSKTTHGNLIIGPTSRRTEAGDTECTPEGLAFTRERAAMSVPDIDFRKNIRNFAGLRAATDSNDFIIEESAEGFIDCAGICSPGLTAAPAIGEYVFELVVKSLERSPKGDIDKKPTRKKDFKSTRKVIRFNSLSDIEREKLVDSQPAYGRVICRCETITEGEILAAFNSPIPPVSIDGIKRRCGSGMGRCQGGFCAPRIAELFYEEFGYDIDSIVMDRSNSRMFFGMTKGGKRNV